MKTIHIIAGAMLALAAVGCASSSKKIATQYVSPVQYKDYDCDTLGLEMARVSRRVGELQVSIDKNAQQDKVATGIGVVLFWPALFFIDGDTPEAAEYARLKGEFEAMQGSASQKKCEIQVQQA
jgi:hypothetical protein